MPSFKEMHDLLVRQGPGRAISSRQTIYKVEARNGNIIAFPKSGRVTIHADCWGDNVTCQGTRQRGRQRGRW